MPIDATADNPWHPFEDRLAFDFANFQFVELEASESKINRALDLWMAGNLKAGGDGILPWSSAKEMYSTIDTIQEGDTPWKTVAFRYTGPCPENPPKWMLQTYELYTRDSRLVLHQQLSTTNFVGEINYVPYHQFKADGDRIWSNLMSADWAWAQAVSFLMFSNDAPALSIANFYHCRTKLLLTKQLTERCLFQYVVGVTRQPPPLVQDNRNTILYTSHLVIFLT